MCQRSLKVILTRSHKLAKTLCQLASSLNPTPKLKALPILVYCKAKRQIQRINQSIAIAILLVELAILPNYQSWAYGKKSLLAIVIPWRSQLFPSLPTNPKQFVRKFCRAEQQLVQNLLRRSQSPNKTMPIAEPPSMYF